MSTTNSSGRKIVEMAARNGLIVANTGNVPTFRRPVCEGTIPDITLISERMADKIGNWKVLETYTASDHQYISYKFIADGIGNDRIQQHRTSIRKWNVSKMDKSALIREIDRHSNDAQMPTDAVTIVKRVMNIIKQGCNKSMPKLKYGNRGRKPVYWWNEEIANARQECLRRRRKFTRARARGEAENERVEYKEARKKLKTSIIDSKKTLWEELREDVNENPWGTGYKLVMGKLGTKSPTPLMSENTMHKIVSSLFPANEIPRDIPNTVETWQIPLFTEEELTSAASQLKNNKSPGPDGIPAEVMKEIAITRPEVLLKMYNSCLREGIFPEVWKKQRLVLIDKGKGDPESPSSYRPLCMLDTAGKLLERLIKPRLNEAVNAGGGISERQYGFRQGRSTIGALKEVVEVVEAAQKQPRYSRPLVLLATLDVKNAFNSLRWPDVLGTLKEKFGIPEYLLQIVGNYLKDRELIYNTTEGERKTRVTSGAAQGSILGPDLWNITYDEILRVEMPQDTFLVGYADDIAAVIRARSTEDIQRKLRQVMIRTRTWLSTHGLQLATQKTELLLLTRRHIPREIDIQVDEGIIRTKKVVSYLGLRLDTKLTYWGQIQYAADKAGKMAAQLSRLMANIGGPIPSRRKLLMEVCNSILLYGCEIWGDKIKPTKGAKILLRVQRIAALRITSAYRTVSAAAVLVIAGIIPIDLRAVERKKMWTAKQATNTSPTEEDTIRQETMQIWQERWNADTTGRWTAKLIPGITKWMNRSHGDVNYYLTQMLSGHGYFRGYLHRMGKCNSPYCLYEADEVIDDAEHTFFNCCRWSVERGELANLTGRLTAANVIDAMMANTSNWSAVSKYCE